jgi:F0F1-type ATP synthase delta subunit
MRVTDYSRAVMELVKDGMAVDSAIANLKRTLESRGHVRLFPKILKSLLVLQEGEQRNKNFVLILAHEDDALKFKDEIRKALLQIGGTHYETRIDPSITGGYIIEGGEQRIDQSYKRRLLTLYRSLIES